ncbi:dehydrogenase [Clostridia bacterium]|nr:dehydrogenase [Clostridia bacterium]
MKKKIIRSKAPLRLGLAGGGTDVSPYCEQYGGCVLNVSINMYAYCTIEPTTDKTISFYAADRKESLTAPSTAKLEIDKVLMLHKGVYNRIVKDYHKGRPLSLKMTTYSDAPAGSGLGSSSTMVVAILKAYTEWLNLPLGEYDLANLAYQIERVDLGLSGGKQDQYAAAFGGFNYIEFFSDNRVVVNPLRIKNWIQCELANSLILYYTGTSRDSAKIIDDQIKSTAENKEDNLQGLHELKIQTKKIKEAILKGDFDEFVECLNQGWESKKKTSRSITNKIIEEMYNFVMQNGGRAAKISGAGGGGFMMIYCEPKSRYELVEKLRNTSGTVMLAEFTEKGTQAWTLYEKEVEPE